MDYGVTAECDAAYRRVGGAMLLFALLILSVVTASSEFAPAPLGPASGVAPSTSGHPLAKAPSAKPAGNCVEAVLDSLEDDDLSAEALAPANLGFRGATAKHATDVRRIASRASAWAHLARGPPSA